MGWRGRICIYIHYKHRYVIYIDVFVLVLTIKNGFKLSSANGRLIAAY